MPAISAHEIEKVGVNCKLMHNIDPRISELFPLFSSLKARTKSEQYHMGVVLFDLDENAPPKLVDYNRNIKLPVYSLKEQEKLIEVATIVKDYILEEEMLENTLLPSHNTLVVALTHRGYRRYLIKLHQDVAQLVLLNELTKNKSRSETLLMFCYEKQGNKAPLPTLAIEAVDGTDALLKKRLRHHYSSLKASGNSREGLLLPRIIQKKSLLSDPYLIHHLPEVIPYTDLWILPNSKVIHAVPRPFVTKRLLGRKRVQGHYSTKNEALNKATQDTSFLRFTVTAITTPVK